MGFSSLSLAALAGLLLGQADAAGPYESIGFVEIPAEVELGAMSAVAVDGQDQIYILHRGELPVLKFSEDGKYLKGWGKGLFKVAHGLRVGPDGAIWTTDNGNHVLRKFSPDGELLATIGREEKAAGGAEGFRAPDDLVFDSKGQIYVADSGNGRIAKLDPSGKFLSQWGKKGKGPGEFATAHGLAIDKADRIYVADRGNQRVQVFESSGEHLADWGGFGNPFGLIVIGEELLASEGDKHLIVHFDHDGKITSKWGTPELLKLPHLMAVNSQGVLFVAEVNGKRIQKFRRK